MYIPSRFTEIHFNLKQIFPQYWMHRLVTERQLFWTVKRCYEEIPIEECGVADGQHSWQISIFFSYFLYRYFVHCVEFFVLYFLHFHFAFPFCITILHYFFMSCTAGANSISVWCHMHIFVLNISHFFNSERAFKWYGFFHRCCHHNSKLILDLNTGLPKILHVLPIIIFLSVLPIYNQMNVRKNFEITIIYNVLIPDYLKMLEWPKIGQKIRIKFYYTELSRFIWVSSGREAQKFK